ncbi:MAG: hypothetical protein EZS28_001380 [Streblomastix strix]|uniref:Uncharacterized protein n=1 Tax=Streblomastix strix TaxID=222440 RepID=A0A5J4X7A9_9EUKA|nr:MAG: hypothetical protein EZS28_001380 [Streblomastix strix]
MDKNGEIVSQLAHRIIIQIIKHINILLCSIDIKNTVSVELVQNQAVNIIEEANEFIQQKLDSGSGADEVSAAVVYIALCTTNIEIQRVMNCFRIQHDEIQSDLQAFQSYVDIVEVFWRISLNEYNSLNSITNSRISAHCINNTVGFLVLCDELIRTILFKENKETNEKLKSCQQKISNIEKIYIDACMDATMMDLLQKVGIWGREWIPNLEDEISNEKNDENCKRKRRRVEFEEDEYEDDQDDYIDNKFNEEKQEELQQIAMKILSQPTTVTKKIISDQSQSESENSSRIYNMRKLNETVQMFVNQEIFGKKAIKVNQIKKPIPIKVDQTITSSDLLSWCFKIQQDIDLTTEVEQEQEDRSFIERWIMPNYESEQISDLIQSVFEELEEKCPNKANEMKKLLKKDNQQERSGLVSLNLSRDLLSFVHNVTGQHITNITKRIFIDKENLFSQIGPKWCVNPFRTLKTKSKRFSSSTSQIANSSTDSEQENKDEQQLTMIKNKRKRQEDNE